jgi:hypothetical protein
MSKYVRIKSRSYLTNHTFPHGVISEMLSYCGKVLKVKHDFGEYLYVEGNLWTWDKDMVMEIFNSVGNKLIKNE